MIAALTPREREVMELVRARLSSKQIGYELGITTPTVENHLRSIYAKLGVHDRWEASDRYSLMTAQMKPRPRKAQSVRPVSLATLKRRGAAVPLAAGQGELA